MKKFWWGIFFGALVGVVFLLPDSNFSNRLRDLVVINIPLFLLALYAFNDVLLKPYIHKKAENLATKEDVGGITREIEKVRLEHSKELEEHKTQNSLRMAAFEQRLGAHQQAYALWWDLRRNVHKDECGEIVIKCQEWWINNNLYLEGEARDAFYKAYTCALNHSAFVGDRNNAELVKNNWKDIIDAGPIIAKSVGLPAIAPDKLSIPRNAEGCQAEVG